MRQNPNSDRGFLFAVLLVALAAGEYFLLRISYWITGNDQQRISTVEKLILNITETTWVAWFVLVGLNILVIGSVIFVAYQLRNVFAPRSSKSGLTFPLGDLSLGKARKRARRILGKKYGLTKKELVQFSGYFKGRELAIQHEDPQLLLGKTRSGKDRTLIFRRILEFPGPVVATSTKTDGIALTTATRQKKGHVAVFELKGRIPMLPHIRWNPIIGCESMEIAKQRAEAFTIGTKDADNSNADWFNSRGIQIIGQLLHAAALGNEITNRQDFSIISVKDWAIGDPHEAINILKSSGSLADADIANSLSQFLSSSADVTLKSFRATITGMMELLDIDSVRHTLTPPTQEHFDAENWVYSSDTVWVISDKESKLTKAVTGMFVEALRCAAYECSARCPNNRLSVPVGFILNELANIAPLKQLPSMMSEGGGRGISTLAVFQNRADIEQVYGRSNADSIFGNAVALYTTGGMNDVSLSQDLAALSREYDHKRQTVSISDTAPSRSISSETRTEISAEDIRSLQYGQLFLRYGRLPAIIVESPDIDHVRKYRKDIKASQSWFEENLNRR